MRGGKNENVSSLCLSESVHLRVCGHPFFFFLSFSNLIGKGIIDMHDMQTPSMHSINLCMRKYFLQSIAYYTNKMKCVIMAPDAEAVKHVFPSGFCFHREISFIYLWLKIKARSLNSLGRERMCVLG